MTMERRDKQQHLLFDGDDSHKGHCCSSLLKPISARRTCLTFERRHATAVDKRSGRRASGCRDAVCEMDAGSRVVDNDNENQNEGSLSVSVIISSRSIRRSSHCTESNNETSASKATLAASTGKQPMGAPVGSVDQVRGEGRCSSVIECQMSDELQADENGKRTPQQRQAQTRATSGRSSVWRALIMLSAVGAVALAPTYASAQGQLEHQQQHFESNHQDQWRQQQQHQPPPGAYLAQQSHHLHQPQPYQHQHAPRPMVAQQPQLQRPPQAATSSFAGDQRRRQQLETALALSHMIMMQRQQHQPQHPQVSAGATGEGPSDEPVGSESEASPNWSTSGEPAGDYLLRGEPQVSGGGGRGVNDASQWQTYGGDERLHQSGRMDGQLPALNRDYNQQHLFGVHHHHHQQQQQQQPATTPTLNRQLLAPPSGGPPFYSAATTEQTRLNAQVHDDEPIRQATGGNSGRGGSGSGNNDSYGNGNAQVHGRDSSGAAEQQAGSIAENNASNGGEPGNGKQQDNSDSSNGAIEQRGAMAAPEPEPRHRRRLFNRILKKAEWNTLFMELSKVFLRYFLDLALKDIIGKQSGAGVSGVSSSSSSGDSSTTTSRKKLDAQSELADLLKDFVKTAISNI